MKLPYHVVLVPEFPAETLTLAFDAEGVKEASNTLEALLREGAPGTEVRVYEAGAEVPDDLKVHLPPWGASSDPCEVQT